MVTKLPNQRGSTTTGKKRAHEAKCPYCEGDYNPRTGVYSHDDPDCPGLLERPPLGSLRGRAEALGALPGTRVERSNVPSLRPMLTLTDESLVRMRERAQFWATGTPEAKKDFEAYIGGEALVMVQLFPQIALSNVGARSGLTNRVQAAKSFFDLAEMALAVVKKTAPVTTDPDDPDAPEQAVPHAQSRRRRKRR